MVSFKSVPNGSITSPQGFQAGAAACGLRSSGTGPDLALLFSDVPCTTAGVFTTLRIKAAPLLLTRRRVRRGLLRAVVANAGCANACTGPDGMRDAILTAQLAARKLGVAAGEVAVASTGVVGVRLEMDRVRRGLDGVTVSPEGGHDFARAIMTTDTVPKEIALRGEIGGVPFTVAGAAKGAGMIHPDMATMLAFITTDAAVDAGFLRQALRRAVSTTFNMITVDGDTSSNDTLLVMSSGLADNAPLTGGEAGETFAQALEAVCWHLAVSIARDGEGATRLIEVRVEGALSQAEARRAARTIAGSNLVKAAVYGRDPNWGRVATALGRSRARLNPSKLDIYLSTAQSRTKREMCLMQGGTPHPFDKAEASALLGEREVVFRVALNMGVESATAWGCDLTPDYVTINSAYTT
ncbi:MAG: bifunctional glutamate N-acetyltransferase/amino-acid acetyltransferase ArgJ [Dehalococcoidia bacterium]|nr:bifunctional glutamate N-acetyltransferase/amino-acid acetyltransferase ArgJ [Dehalococcoidia bacterium]